MIFYLALDEAGHKQLAGTQADARAINKDFEQIDIPTDKAGLMAFVQNLYDETLTGVADECRGEPTHLPPLPVSTPEPSYMQQSIAIEDAWEVLPLTMKLHFAASAMEDARTALQSGEQK